VGWGIFSAWPSVSVEQSAGRLFNSTMLCTETLKAKAIPPQVSPSLTEYWKGVGLGSGVLVMVGGIWVAVVVTVGVRVIVGVIVASDGGGANCCMAK
jgi:hypothetical protein